MARESDARGGQSQSPGGTDVSVKEDDRTDFISGPSSDPSLWSVRQENPAALLILITDSGAGDRHAGGRWCTAADTLKSMPSSGEWNVIPAKLESAPEIQSPNCQMGTTSTAERRRRGWCKRS